MRPLRKSTIILPEGVGVWSPTPTGMDGFTITTGAPRRAKSRAASSARYLERL